MKDAEVTKSDIGEVILVGGKYILFYDYFCINCSHGYLELANFERFGKDSKYFLLSYINISFFHSKHFLLSFKTFLTFIQTYLTFIQNISYFHSKHFLLLFQTCLTFIQKHNKLTFIQEHTLTFIKKNITNLLSFKNISYFYSKTCLTFIQKHVLLSF